MEAVLSKYIALKCVERASPKTERITPRNANELLSSDVNWVLPPVLITFHVVASVRIRTSV